MLLRRLIFIGSLTATLGAVHDATAQSSSFEAASKAWENGSLDAGARGYEQAIRGGGLAPQEVLTAYARMGTYKAALGKQDEALSAFRLAASLDPDFELPDESGPKAALLYKKAHAEAEGLGGKLDIRAEVPFEVPAAKPFTVVAHLPEAFAPLVDRVSIEVKYTLTGQAYRSTAPADAEVQFDVPARAVPSGATLVVRVDALDVHDNRFATSEARVKVTGAQAGLGGPNELSTSGPAAPPADEGPGFWQSPWPYAIAGGIVAASLVTFFATRPPSEVMVAAPRWK